MAAPRHIYNVFRKTSLYGLKGIIHLYKGCISPFTPPSCRFFPSCSAYMMEALEFHGPRRGLILGLKRLSRCHPWNKNKGGYDPVPSCTENCGKD